MIDYRLALSGILLALLILLVFSALYVRFW